MRSSAFSTCWDEQRLPWKSQAVHSSMLHRMVQPAYLTFRQQCRQTSTHYSNSSSSSGSGSSISRVAGVATQQLQQETHVHARLQQAPAQLPCCNHMYGDCHNSWSSSAQVSSAAHNNVHSMRSMQAVLNGPVTNNSSSSSSSSSAARGPGGSPGPGKPGKDGDEFGPNFGGKVTAEHHNHSALSLTVLPQLLGAAHGCVVRLPNQSSCCARHVSKVHSKLTHAAARCVCLMWLPALAAMSRLQ
jgi:hypothetical protein